MPDTQSTVTTSGSIALHASNPESVNALGNEFPLGPFDSLVSTAVPVAVCFVYEPYLEEVAISYDRLKQSMERLLDYYPQLTGRLRADPQSDGRSIIRLGDGADLIHAHCSISLSDLPRDDQGRLSIVDFPDGGNDLLPPFDPMNVEGNPILAVKYTRFACGSVSLGIRCHHVVCDGSGFFQMVGHLAEIYSAYTRSSTTSPTKQIALADPPIIDPYLAHFPSSSQAELDDARSYIPNLYTSDPSPAVLPGTPLHPVAPVTGRIIHLEPEYLSALKRSVTSDGDWTSTFAAVMTKLYHATHRARIILRQEDNSGTLPDLSPPDLLISINVRGDRFPQTPKTYFPNAVLTPNTSMDPDDLFNADIRDVNKRVNSMLRDTPSPNEVERTLRWIAAQPDKRHIKSGFRFGNGCFAAAQWSGFDMYGMCTFAGNRPVLVAPPFTAISLCDGLAYTLPATPRTDGNEAGLTLNLSLSGPLWDVIDRHDLLGLKGGL